MLGLERESADLNTGHRAAVIDIGSNTVRLVIYGGARRAPTILWNEKVSAQLGRSLAETGAMDAESVRDALASIARYKALLDGLGITDIQAVATSAPRDAVNGPEFLEDIRAMGVPVRLLSGEEEAISAAMGVVGAFPRAEGVVADLGGGSLELVEIGGGGYKSAVSLPLGTLRLPALRSLDRKSFRAKVVDALDAAGWDHAVDKPVYMVGGTLRAFATYAIRQPGSILDDPHGLVLTGKNAAKLAKKLAKADPEELANTNGVTPMRAAALPDAAALLNVLFEEFQPATVVFSSWGLREGLLYQRLSPQAQRQDPLIAGVAAFTAPRGGRPDLAVRIAGWTTGGLPASGYSSERLRLAATMLAIASMQVEPNFRARQAVDWALHKRWVGLDASGRAIIAAALAASCKGMNYIKDLAELADPDAINEAVSWGLAIRLFRRLGINSLISCEASALVQEDGCLKLILADQIAALANSGVESDLAELAGSIGLESSVELVANDRFFSRRNGTTD